VRDRSAADAFRAAYADAFARYLAAPDEGTLQAAYELGRDAVTRELNVLDLSLVHHEALAATLACGDAAHAAETTAAASSFFTESLSAFEMVRRGFRDVRDAALAERRQTALLRRLSSFLADASLAAGGSESHQELLQLVAEQALELIDAEYCVATASDVGARPTVAFAACGAEPQAVPAWIAAAAEHQVWRGPAPPVSGTDGEEANTDTGSERPRSALTAPLRGLDGHALGSVQLFNRREGEFTDADEAVLVHLAELAAAALERTQLYSNAPAPARRER
jgi:GAF domain-containing protein